MTGLQPELWDDDEWDAELVGEEDEWEDEGGMEDEEDSNAEDNPNNDYPDEPQAGRSNFERDVSQPQGD